MNARGDLVMTRRSLSSCAFRTTWSPYKYSLADKTHSRVQEEEQAHGRDEC